MLDADIDQREVDKKTINVENKMETSTGTWVSRDRRRSHVKGGPGGLRRWTHLGVAASVGDDDDELAGGARSTPAKYRCTGRSPPGTPPRRRCCSCSRARIFMLAATAAAGSSAAATGGAATPTRRSRLFMVTAGFLMAGGIIGLGEGHRVLVPVDGEGPRLAERNTAALGREDRPGEYTECCHWGCAIL